MAFATHRIFQRILSAAPVTAVSKGAVRKETLQMRVSKARVAAKTRPYIATMDSKKVQESWPVHCELDRFAMDEGDFAEEMPQLPWLEVEDVRLGAKAHHDDEFYTQIKKPSSLYMEEEEEGMDMFVVGGANISGRSATNVSWDSILGAPQRRTVRCAQRYTERYTFL